MRLIVHGGLLSVIKFPSSSPIPDVVLQSLLLAPECAFVAVTRTKDELSIVVPSYLVQDLRKDAVSMSKESDRTSVCFEEEGGFRSLKISGVLDFSLIGIIADLSKILADARIGIFVISTFNTDYILVKEDNLKKAVELLKLNGHEITEDAC